MRINYLNWPDYFCLSKIKIVLINHTREIIFFRARKTAGSSVESYLIELFSKLGDQIEGLDMYEHTCFTELTDKLTPDELTYKKIVIIRDPYDMTVSWFWWLHRDKKFKEKDVVRYFRRWVQNKMTNFNDEFFNDTVNYDYVLRFEFLEEDLKKLLSLLDIQVNFINLPKLKTEYRDKKFSIAELFDDHTVEAVNEKLRWFFDRGFYEINSL